MSLATRHRVTVVPGFIVVALLLAGCAQSGAPDRHSPTKSGSTVGTLYSPPADAPAPGALYARALQIRHPGPSRGDLLATFEQYTSGRPVFPIYRSTDDGAHWAKYSSIRDIVNGWGLRYQPTLYELPQAVGGMKAGTILAVGNSIPDDLSKTQLDMYQSGDEGHTWTFVSHIASGGRAEPNNGETPVWEPFLVVANNKLIVYYSDQRDAAHGQKLVHQTTVDGLAWTPPVDDVAVEPYDARPGMPTVARMGNGVWAMTYEYGGAPDGDFAAYIKFAKDPEQFGTVDGNAITAHGFGGTSSPYVIWVNNGKKGELVVSVASTQDLFVNKDYGDPAHWTTIPSKVPQGYTRSFVVLADNHHIFGISGGAIGATNNDVTYATDDLGKQ